MGKIIVIEGSDSSGKETQTRLLYEKLQNIGEKILKISFPNYDSPASEPVKMYLAGKFGEDPLKTNAYPISTMYAIDRYASFKQDWEKFYNDDYVILTDRYTTSNFIHQASKIKNNDEKKEYLSWLEDLEYKKFNIPEPDLVIFLNMPPKFSFELMKERKNKITGENKKDIHEKSEEYLIQSYNNACEIANLYKWNIIDCVNKGKIKTIEEINEEILNEVKKIIGG